MLVRKEEAQNGKGVKIMQYTDFDSMPMVLSVRDIAETLAIGRNAAYNLVNTGEIRALRIGNHFRIPREAFIEFLKRPVATT